MKEIIFASNNAGKLWELREFFTDKNISIIAQSEYNVPEVAETGTTFVENAIIKARHAARYANAPVLADDSGIAVDALHGRPGVYSARYAGEKATSSANVAKLLYEMQNVPEGKRQARFYCALVLMRHAEDAAPLIAQGVWHGTILHQAQGSGGFGYDPVFYVPDHDCSAAEIDAAEKNRISHRGQALNKIVDMICHFW